MHFRQLKIELIPGESKVNVCIIGFPAGFLEFYLSSLMESIKVPVTIYKL